MATSTITARTTASSGNVTGGAYAIIDDSNSNTRKVSLATMRTRMFAGGTGFTATDPLAVGVINVSGAAGTSAQIEVLETAGRGYGIAITNRNANQRWAMAVDAASVDDMIFSISDLTNGNEALRLDHSVTAGDTRFWIYSVDTAAISRVKTGASGTGPGGSGRALFI